MVTSITLKTFKERSAYLWEFDADDWILVTDTNGLPLWEFKRGSLFVFENEKMPRLEWTKFRRGLVGDNLTQLREYPVVVLTVRGADTFLVRLPQPESEEE
jgi:hypothetical protein